MFHVQWSQGMQLTYFPRRSVKKIWFLFFILLTMCGYSSCAFSQDFRNKTIQIYGSHDGGSGGSPGQVNFYVYFKSDGTMLRGALSSKVFAGCAGNRGEKYGNRIELCSRNSCMSGGGWKEVHEDCGSYELVGNKLIFRLRQKLSSVDPQGRVDSISNNTGDSEITLLDGVCTGSGRLSYRSGTTIYTYSSCKIYNGTRF